MDEQLLLKNISLGDEKAFQIIFDRYSNRVYVYALKLLKSEEVAEEIVHDVFLKLWKQPVAATIDNVEAYLKVAARNMVFNAMRKERLVARVSQHIKRHSPGNSNITEEMIQYQDTVTVFQEAVKALPPQQRQVYLLCRSKGMQYVQAARVLSISPLTVKTHMQKALRFLRGFIKR